MIDPQNEVDRAVGASLIVRTFNEARWLPSLFDLLSRQTGVSFEVIVVDSGSEDGSVEIARAAGARIMTIRKQDFSFGRSLNLGCEAARGRNLVFVSGHCLPCGDDWLARLIAPLDARECSYSYGRQVAHAELTKFSESRLFEKFFPNRSSGPTTEIHCNNANAAIVASAWRDHRFDESLTGLEDMELAKRLVRCGHKIGYVADAPVVHIHEESWDRVRLRFEREAVALQHILPEIHLSVWDAARYCASGVWHDIGAAYRKGLLRQKFNEIVCYRLMQYYGTFKGNTLHRKLSRAKKEMYFYPAPRERAVAHAARPETSKAGVAI